MSFKDAVTRLWKYGTTADIDALVSEKVRNQLDPWNNAYYDTSSGLMFGGGGITPENAMREATVFACVRILSEGVAQMDLNLINEDDQGNQTHAKGNPLYNVLKRKPCTWLSGYSYWKWNMINLCLRGFFLSKKAYSPNGKIVSLIPMHPDYTQFEQAADGTYIFKSVSVQNVQKKNFKAVETIMQKDAYFSMYATLDGFTPVSPIKYAAEAIKAAGKMRQHGSKFFNNTAVPPGVLSTPDALTDDAFKRMRDSWQETYGGENSGKVAILEQGLKFEAISITNEDAQYLETRGYTREEIAAIFGVPPYMVGDTKQAKGWSTIEAQSSDLLRWTFNPWIKRIEDDTLISLIPRNLWGSTYAKFDTMELTRGNMADRQSYYNGGIQNGWLSPNEVRQAENMNKRDGGDEFLTPMNMNSSNDEDEPEEEPVEEPVEEEVDDDNEE